MLLIECVVDAILTLGIGLHLYQKIDVLVDLKLVVRRESRESQTICVGGYSQLSGFHFYSSIFVL